MALSNLFGWNKEISISCGSACGAGDKPSTCGAGDNPSKPSACGAGDK